MKKVQWVGPMSRIISLFNNFSVNLPPLAPQCETGKNWGGIKMWWNRIKMWGGTVVVGKHYNFRQNIFDRPFFHFPWKIFDTTIFDRKFSTIFFNSKRKFSTDFLKNFDRKFSMQNFRLHEIRHRIFSTTKNASWKIFDITHRKFSTVENYLWANKWPNTIFECRN